MKKLTFTKQEKTLIIQRIQDYFADELDQDIGQIPAEMLLNFFTEQFGNYYYNRGLNDAHGAFMGKMDDFADIIYSLEQPTDLRR